MNYRTRNDANSIHTIVEMFKKLSQLSNIRLILFTTANTLYRDHDRQLSNYPMEGIKLCNASIVLNSQPVTHSHWLNLPLFTAVLFANVTKYRYVFCTYLGGMENLAQNKQDRKFNINVFIQVSTGMLIFVIETNIKR